jgi:recombination protein RecR
MGPEQLRMKELIDRCNRGGIKEVIVATNPDVEGEATAMYIQKQISEIVPAVTRLAHGLPMGADIEFADQITLKMALAGRRDV